MIKIYHFLGSVTFALILITLAALFVIAGTFLESAAGSHLYAASLTYSHPVFNLLLGGFFLNILFSATRRWPFQKKHIPFLLTHLGLLMLIAGAGVKSFYGKQGIMRLIEGGASQTLFLPNTYAIHIETRSDRLVTPLAGSISLTHELSAKLANYFPNAASSFSTWIKGDDVDVSGFAPQKLIALDDLRLNTEELSLLHWNIIGVKAQNPAEVLDKIFGQIVAVKLVKSSGSEVLYEGPFRTGLTIPSDAISLHLVAEDPSCIAIKMQQEQLILPLTGKNALLCVSKTLPFLGASPLQVDLSAKPLLVFIQGPSEQVWLTAIDSYGRVYQQDISPQKLETYLSHDDGFQGYTTQVSIPLGLAPKNRQNIEAEKLVSAKQEIEKLELSTPGKLIKEACDRAKLDFAPAALDFITAWHTSRHLLPFNQLLSFSIDRALISPHDYKTCCWMVKLYKELEREMMNARNPVQWLRQNRWPFMGQFETLNREDITLPPDQVEPFLDLVAKQLYTAAPILPDTDESDTAALLGAYMRLYGIQHTRLISQADADAIDEDVFTFETTIKPSIQPQFASRQLEKNKPSVTLLLERGKTCETISLPFEESQQGLKWAVMNGACLLRFQPETVEIPFRIRLRNARQLNYSTSTAAASFESSLLVTDTRTGNEVEVTLSMNRVYETWDGWRFYLSTLFSENETEVHQIQLVVNFDPLKYWLTYPGAALMSLGILLLFWFKPYRLD